MYMVAPNQAKDVISAPSLEELKAYARKDSKENGRAPERYFYECTEITPLFNTEECGQVDYYNLIYLNEQKDK